MEQAKGHTGNNIVTVLMKAKGLLLQEAFDFVGAKFKSLMEGFITDKTQLRTFGPDIDAYVQQYVMSLEHWIKGNLVWSFETQRYFGPAHLEVKRKLVVHLQESNEESDGREEF